MKQLINEKMINGIDKVIIVYTLPLAMWAISLIEGFSGAQKVELTILYLTILIGLELYSKSFTQLQITQPFKKVKKAMPDINLSLTDFLSPNVIILLILSTSFGGILGYIYLEPTLSSFLIIGFMFFSIILGLEFFIQDLFIKPKKLKEHDFLIYLYHNTWIGTLLNYHKLSVLVSCLGYYTSHLVVGENVLFNLLGALSFFCIYKGLSYLK